MKKVALCLLLFLFFLGLSAGVAFAENDADVLTLEEAIELALKNSASIQQAEYTVERTRIEREEAWDMYNAVLINTNIPGTDMYISVPTGADPQGLVFRSDYAWRAAQKDYNTLKETITAGVIKGYYGVLQSQAQVETLAKSVASKERELRDAEARLQVGMEAPFSITQKRAAMAGERAKLSQAKDALEKSYADFEQLVGLRPGSRPVLSKEIEFEPMKITAEELGTVIDGIISASPDIWKTEEAVKLQENTFGMMNSSSVDLYNLRSARLNVDMAKDRLYLVVLGLFYNAQGLESSYEAARESANMAREALRVTRLRYDLGMATVAEVLSAEAAYAAAEQQLLALAAQHDMAVKSFWKPWAWAGSA